MGGAGADRHWPLAFGVYSISRRARQRLPLHARRRAVPLAVLLAGPRQTRAPHQLHVRVLRHVGPARVPAHLLLLPQGVLPRVLPGPARCAVAGSGAALPGRDALPFVLLNFHRFFLYLAAIVSGSSGTTRSGRSVQGRRRLAHFGVGLGSLIMLVNVILLSVHVRVQLTAPPDRRQAELLHVLAGRAHASSALAMGHGLQPPPHGACLDQPREVGLTDLYIRLIASGAFTDPKIF